MSSKEENNGLLSKVVKFVRNPTTNWGDLDQQESDRESNYSKQMLKEMIERKRRNDFVRKREFDMLRKMRRSEVMAGQDPGARPSFFQSSMPSKPDDRATTLKKIDEIEAQMSMQWWKTKHGESAPRPAGASNNFPMSSHVPPDALGRPDARSAAYSRTAPLPLGGDRAHEPTEPAELRPMMEADEDDSYAGVSMHAAPAPAPVPSRAVELAAAEETVAAPLDSTSFSASKVFAIDVDEFAHDPELEEASIRFANGDNAGAEAGLLEVLAPDGPRIKHDETWLTLFDLYRATGQHERFESAALDFAGRFARSAPQWVSFPEAVGRMNTPAPSVPTAGTSLADWTCPSSLGTQTLAAMNAALGRSAQPWRLSWTKLNSIDSAALEGLTRAFTQWTTQPVQLRFIGADKLERVLADATVSGDKSVDPAWWRLRMEVLRVMHRPDEFELAALDYCVTYEVSPPSWEGARCEYKALQADGSAMASNTIIGEAFHDSLSSGLMGYGDTGIHAHNAHASNVSTVELAGEILGDATEPLEMLESRLAGADVMVITCARLIRIDFSAAGMLLNWVTARQAEGRQVQFIEVHRLVAAFFNVIGISEHARVMARTD
jgi:ABC-type transporter Mla MlaB component